MRAIREKAAMTQHELAKRLDVSRKTVIRWEASEEHLDQGVTLQLLKVAGQIRVIENTFRVAPTNLGSYMVARRCIRNLPTARAASYTSVEVVLYGLFKRLDHASRWCTALQNAVDPRCTRELLKERAREFSMDSLSAIASSRRVAHHTSGRGGWRRTRRRGRRARVRA